MRPTAGTLVIVDIAITTVEELRFSDGSPVRAASAITRIGEDWIIAQDDATHAAVWRAGPATRVRLFAPVAGNDTFSADEGTKDRKPDVEAACTVDLDGVDVVLLLGSGSLPNRMRGAVVRRAGPGWDVRVRDLSAVYRQVAAALDLAPQRLNLEGACVVGPALRWFQRGHANGVASAAVDVDVATLSAAVNGEGDTSRVRVGAAIAYDLGRVEGVPLAITDAVALPDGRIIVSAAAEDARDAVADGPIVGSALAVLDGSQVSACVPLPAGGDGSVWKVEGLAVESVADHEVRLVAVVDQDNREQPSKALHLTVVLD